MTSWTEEQARSLITDPGTLKRGQELAAPAKWSNLGRTDTAAWGECKGSGSKPYQTGLDLTEPAFKCSCPSRVFPCKHGAGLLLLLARQPQLLSNPTPPPWLQEWLDKRQQTQNKKASQAPGEALLAPTDAPATATTAVADNELARQKREAQRLGRMQQGIEELETWLVDLVRAGLAATESRPLSFWENQAARLVDNQLPGLATVIRELPDLRHQSTNWPERLLARLGELYVLARAFQRLPALSAEARQEVLQQVGVTVKKEEVLSTQPAITDEWRVLTQTTTEEERLIVRRSWLHGHHTGRFALVVEFSFGGQAFATSLVADGRYTGALTFYPGLLPLRAVPGPLAFVGLGTAAPPSASSLPALLEDYATALAQLPWLREWPVLLTGGIPTLTATGHWVLRFAALPAVPDPNEHPTSPPSALLGTDLQLLCSDTLGWELRASSGGVPVTVFGEWMGQALRPLACWGAPSEIYFAS